MRIERDCVQLGAEMRLIGTLKWESLFYKIQLWSCSLTVHKLRSTSPSTFIAGKGKIIVTTKHVLLVNRATKLKQSPMVKVLPLRTGSRRNLKRWLMGTADFFLWIKTTILWWRCTGNTVSTIWSSGTMRFTGCRCRTSRPMSVAILTAATWQSRAWTPRRSNTWWGIAISGWRWIHTRTLDWRMLRMN